MQILYVASEGNPFCASGGLGDVIGALPKTVAQISSGDEVSVVLPLYGKMKEEYRARLVKVCDFSFKLSWRSTGASAFVLEEGGVKYYFLENHYYFNRDNLYGEADDGERFAFYSMAVCEFMLKSGLVPDVLHANDWQTALTVIYLKTLYASNPTLSGIRTVYTIHNIEYQGKYDFYILGDVFALSEEDRKVVEYGDCINLMKGAIECAEAVTTVSPRYADEIMSPEYSHGLYHILRANASKVSGILNGIDYSYYNPWTDPVLVKRYSAKRRGGKDACRSALRADLNLVDEKGTPVIALITRLASHKGLDIVAEAMRGILDESGAQLVVLGKGEAKYEEFFRQLEAEYPDKVRALITYDRDLSKKIYAAADIL